MQISKFKKKIIDYHKKINEDGEDYFHSTLAESDRRELWSLYFENEKVLDHKRFREELGKNKINIIKQSLSVNYGKAIYYLDLAIEKLGNQKKLSRRKKNRYLKLINEGESQRVEFKHSMRWSQSSEDKPKDYSEYIVARTIASFMNVEGGTLFIGIADDGSILGLKDDYKTLGKKNNKDGFLLHLDSLINKFLGKENHAFFEAHIEKMEEKEVCVLEIDGCLQPVHVKWRGDEEFFIRTSAATRKLSPIQASIYMRNHWQ